MGFDPGFGRVVPPGVAFIAGGGWRNAQSSNPHAGIDLILPVGTPILAAADGIVSGGSSTNSGDAGIYADVLHANGIKSRYLHFSQLLVGLGQSVRKGQQLGFSGNTGNSAGPHLHFEMRGPEQTVADAVAIAGTPVGGLAFNLPSIGIGIPAEPWLPVDGYAADVIASSKALGIPLFNEVPHGSPIIKALLIGVLAIGAYSLITGDDLL